MVINVRQTVYSNLENMNLAYIFTDGRLRRVNRIVNGEAPADFLHGSEQMRQRGHNVDLYELSTIMPYKWMKAAGDILSSMKILPHKIRGELLGQTWGLLPQLRGYDVVMVSGSPAAHALALWKCIYRFKTEIIAIQCGMLNYPFSLMQRQLSKHLQGQMWTMLFAKCEQDPYCKIVGHKYAHRVSVNEFAVDNGFWTPANKDVVGDYIFSIGNDGRRDYGLLMRVAYKLQIPFIVVTRSKIPEPIPANVRVIIGDFRQEIMTDIEIRDLYRRARVVVVPLLDSLQPSGQSVCVQAMACGKAVVLSVTKGLWSREKLENGENIFLVPTGDETAMANMLADVYHQRDILDRVGQSARATVDREWTLEQYADGVEHVCRLALSTRKLG